MPVMSVHLVQLGAGASVGALRRVPAGAPGLLWADVGAGARFGRGVLPAPVPGRTALLALWEDDAAADAFFASDAAAARTFAPGWSVRLQPLRQTGAIAGLPPLVAAEQPVEDDEPVAVLTYGHTRYRTLKPFLQANQRATADALDNPALLAATGLARPPRMVGTFSLWRTAREMKDYAYAQAGHPHAMRENVARTFHHEQLFARFRPYGGSGGVWA